MNIRPLKYLANHVRTGLSGRNFDRQRSEWFYFLHIQKAAGTTFRHMLYSYFDQPEIYPNYFELNVKQQAKMVSWRKFRLNQATLFPRHKRLLIGHFGWAPVSHFADHPPRILTFVRDPARRVMSSIIYHQKRNRIYKHMDIDTILDRHLAEEGSRQAFKLGYRPEDDNLSQVLERLEEIDFIGISERFDESLELCNRTFDWQLKPIRKRNVGRYTAQTFTAAQCERIEAGCQIDSELYARANELFDQRLPRPGQSSTPAFSA